MEDKKIERLILKDDDILVVKISLEMFYRRNILKSLYTQIKKQLLPRKNKILMLPDNIELSVIGKEQIEEYVSHIDLWSLFDEDGEETTGEGEQL